jgi:bifunctional DNA primase/polymerase-like protein
MSPQSQGPQSQAQPNTPTVFEAALDYARCGIPIFPCNPIDKKPLTPNGFKDATRDETQILAWWQQYPNAMIGAPTGPASNTWAIDLDFDPAKNIDGKATLDQLIAQHTALPSTWMTITPRGGRHLIFSWDPNVEIRNSAGKMGPGIDVRGNGGYICLPPSQNATGGTYQWEPGGPQIAALAPGWLIALAKANKASAYARAALDRECKGVACAQPGTRNSALNTAAFNLFQLVAGGALDEQEVRDRLFEAAVTCGLVADDGAASVEATIDSGAQAGCKQPRTRPRPAPQGGVRPTIDLMDGQLLRIIGETEEALLASGLPIFSRAGMLVEPVSESMSASDGRKTVVARLRPLSPESFLGPAAESATFRKYDRKRNQWVDTDPPLRHVRVILASERRWRFPHVTGVITTPTLRPDGSLLAEPGYDPETELYLLPGFSLPPVPEHSTKDQARAALNLLTDLLSEFSFRRIDGEHQKKLNRSVALSGLLTALVRGSLPTAPMHLVRAHMAGTGKSYLVDLIATIATGRICPVITALKSVDETEKRLGSIVLSGIAMVSLDNCIHDLEGELLCQIAERPVVKIRILGSSEMPDCECHTALYATGNNVTFKGDMVRRGVVCDLEALDERPELREFKRNALRQAAGNRGTYVAAALTIMRAYLAAGAPSVCGPFGSYAEWSTMVRSPLVWLEEPDPVASVDKTQTEDPELAELREWFELWLGEFRLDTTYTSASFVEAASVAPAGFNSNPLKELLLRIAGDRNGDISAKRLGEWLRRNSGRVVRVADGRKFWLVREPHVRDGRAQYRLREVT